jgi:hypothetical protein
MWALVTVPQREHLADALLEQLEDPAVKLVDQAGDIQANHIRAWTKVCEYRSDWVGVMQDDVVLAHDFSNKLRKRLREAASLGYRAVSFYNNSHSDRFLESVNDRWKRVDLARAPAIRRPKAKGRTVQSAVQGELCVVVRREVAIAYPEFAQRHSDLYRMFPDVHDGLLGLFLNSTIGGGGDIAAIDRSQIYIAFPNLVDHRADIPSCFPSHEVRRTSSSFRADGD